MNILAINFDNTADVNLAYNQLKKLYPKNRIAKIEKDFDELIEELEDEYLLNLALERKKNDNGVRYSFEEILAERGLTLEDIDNMEDVELEYELPC